MKCPHCKKEIDNKTINAHFAKEGGKKSRRAISKEAQAKMQAARKKAKPKEKKVVT